MIFLSPRKDLIARIEAVTLKIIEQISTGQAPCISYFSGQNIISKSSTHEENIYTGCSVDSFREEMMFFNGTLLDFAEEQDANNGDTFQNSEKTTVDFAVKNSRNKFVLMMLTMAEAHRLLLTNTIKTKRSFYYDLKNETTKYLVPNQGYVDRALNDIANLLECAPWDLSEFTKYFLIRKTNQNSD